MSKKREKLDSVDTLEAFEQLHRVVKSNGYIKVAESLKQCLDEWRAMHKVLEVEKPSIDDAVRVWKRLDRATSRSVRCISALIPPQAQDLSTSSDEDPSEKSASDSSSSSSSSERSKNSSSSSSSSSRSEGRRQHKKPRYHSGQGNVPKSKKTLNVSSPSPESETDSDSDSSSSNSQIHVKKDLPLNSQSDKPMSSASSASSSSASSSSSSSAAASSDSSSSSSSSSDSESDSGISSTLQSESEKDGPPKKKRKTEDGVKAINREDTAASKVEQVKEKNEAKKTNLVNGPSAETTNGDSKASTPVTSTSNTAENEKKVKQARKSNTPFQRIKVDKVAFTDERLKDNSFHSRRAKPGDYGERAHADLIVTRGDSFRKEKNKKKRGSYRGGEITLESHSIKFT